MRFTHIVLAYFVIGAVMWGGGAIVWDQAGVGQLFIDDPANGATVNESTSDQLSRLGGPIQESSTGFGSGLIAAWNGLVKFVGYLFWPITVLQSQNAPTSVVVLFGGTPTVSFYGTLLKLIRTSA